MHRRGRAHEHLIAAAFLLLPQLSTAEVAPRLRSDLLAPLPAPRARPTSPCPLRQARDVFVSIFLSPRTPLTFNEMLQRVVCPVALVYGKEDPWWEALRRALR